MTCIGLGFKWENLIIVFLLKAGGSWANVASQATQKRPWNEKNQAFSRGGRQAESRNNAQVT